MPPFVAFSSLSIILNCAFYCKKTNEKNCLDNFCIFRRRFSYGLRKTCGDVATIKITAKRPSGLPLRTAIALPLWPQKLLCRLQFTTFWLCIFTQLFCDKKPCVVLEKLSRIHKKQDKSRFLLAQKQHFCNICFTKHTK